MTREMSKPSTVRAESEIQRRNISPQKWKDTPSIQWKQFPRQWTGDWRTEFSASLLNVTIETGGRSWRVQNHRCSYTDRTERTTAKCGKCHLSTCLYIQDETYYKRIPLLAASSGNKKNCLAAANMAGWSWMLSTAPVICLPKENKWLR